MFTRKVLLNVYDTKKDLNTLIHLPRDGEDQDRLDWHVDFINRPSAIVLYDTNPALNPIPGSAGFRTLPFS